MNQVHSYNPTIILNDFIDLKLGYCGEEVKLLCQHLKNIGFYPVKSSIPSSVDEALVRAIKKYQTFYQLKQDGIVGKITRNCLQHARCGNPDIPSGAKDDFTAAAYVATGCKYDKETLLYSIEKYPLQMQPQKIRTIIDAAFNAWSNVTRLNFIYTDGRADLRIRWQQNDGSASLGGHFLGKAYYPPWCGGTNAGLMILDSDEHWAETAEDGIILYNVVLHEIGHLLGLSHSNNPSSIMHAQYHPRSNTISTDDIAGIESIYGSSSI